MNSYTRVLLLIYYYSLYTKAATKERNISKVNVMFW